MPQPLTRGILYSQADGFSEFGPPIPPPYDRERLETWLGWTRHAPDTWLTHDERYPLVVDYMSPDLAIWFATRADWVHYMHQYVDPQLALDRIERAIDAVRHGQHDSGREPCAVCENKQRWEKVLDSIGERGN